MSLALAQLPANAQQILYGVTGAGASASTLYTIDPTTGTATPVGTGIGFDEVVSIDFHPNGTLYGIANGLNASPPIPATLIAINITTGIGTAVKEVIGAVEIFSQSPDMSFDSFGTLYVWNEALVDNLTTVNLTTGVATDVGPSGLSTNRTGLAVDPNDTIYLRFYDDPLANSFLYTVDPADGSTAPVTAVEVGPDNALAFDAGGTLYTVNRAGVDSVLSTIDLTDGTVTSIGPTGQGKLAALAFGPESDTPDEPIDVDVDIKPDSDPNSINLCSNGAVPVAILGSETFDVMDINTESLRFADAAVKVVGKKDQHTLCSYEDVNDDTYIDLVCHFVTMDIAGIGGESLSATVKGKLLGEPPATEIIGSNSVNIVKDTCN
jgi:hypothetical protein